MAPFVPVANGCQVEILHLLGGVSIENRLWFTFDNPPFGEPEVQGLSDGVRDWWRDMILPYLSQDLETTAVIARDWLALPTTFFTVSLLNQVGGVAGESSTANVALVIPFRWGLGIRLKRNKHYVPGIPEQEITLNTPSEAIKVAMFEGYNSLIDRTRLFYPFFNWRWVATSAWSNTVLRSSQYASDVQGTVRRGNYKLGQRRRRLPQPDPPA